MGAEPPRLTTLFEEPGLPSVPLPAALREGYDGDLGFADDVLYANFVETLDGVVALDPETPPSAISGKSQADRFVMGLLRAFASAVVVGASTLRAEPKHLWTPSRIYPELSDAYAELRRSLGREGEPQLFLLTASGDVDVSLPAFEQGAVVLTTDEGAARVRGSLPSASRAIGMGGGRPSMRAVVEVVRSEGHRVVLTEGGPTVFGSFLGEGLIDELFLTLSPRVAGRAAAGRLGLVEGVAFAPSELRHASLLSAKRHSSHLFLRYRIEH